MMAHTPGPWLIQGESGNDGEAFVIGTSGKAVCYTSDTYDEEEDEGVITPEDQSNATLIAAAPDLLAALKGLLLLMPGQVWNEMAVRATGGPDEVNQAADLAAAAINKAEGKVE